MRQRKPLDAIYVYSLASGALLVGLLVTFGIFLVRTIQVIAYPYETEGWESNDYLATLRLAARTSCYGWPVSATYPTRFYSYPPLYPALCGLAHRMVMALFSASACGLWINKSVAVFFALACGAAIYAIVYRKTKNNFCAAIAALLLTGIEPHSSFLNVARVDTLGMFFALMALWAVGSASAKKRRWFVPFALLAVLTKQPFLIAGITGLVYTSGRDRREALRQAGLYFGILLAVGIALNLATHGAFWNDVVRYQKLVKSDTLHPLIGPIGSFLRYGGWLLRWSLIPQVVASWYVARHWRERYQSGGQWLLAYPMITLFTLVTLFQWGANTNRLLPALVACLIVFGFALAELGTLWNAISGRSRVWIVAVPALTLLSVARYACRPEWINMAEENRAEMEALAALCRTAPGPVLSEMPRVAVQQARPDAVQGLFLLKPQFGPGATAQLQALQRDFETQKYALVIFHTGFGRPSAFVPVPLYEIVRQKYERVGYLPASMLEIFRRRPRQ